MRCNYDTVAQSPTICYHVVPYTNQQFIMLRKIMRNETNIYKLQESLKFMVLFETHGAYYISFPFKIWELKGFVC